MTASASRVVNSSGLGRVKTAFADTLELARPGVRRDGHGYVVDLDDNLLPGITRSQIETAFSAGAGQELEGKMRAPWSSSALAVNSFFPWHKQPALLSLAGISGFTGAVAFEAKCPNGVSRIPPHLDVRLEREDAIVAVESKCTEHLARKTAKVADAYRDLAAHGDERATTRWFGALAEASKFRHLDAYQLVKHYLGLARTYSGRTITLVYLYWEPTDPGALPAFAEHRAEVDRFRQLVADDRACAFKAISYPEHWRELERVASKPDWLDAHLIELKRRYEFSIGGG